MNVTLIGLGNGTKAGVDVSVGGMGVKVGTLVADDGIAVAVAVDVAVRACVGWEISFGLPGSLTQAITMIMTMAREIQIFRCAGIDGRLIP